MKKRGSHTSLIDGAILPLSILEKYKIQYAPGIIKTSLPKTKNYIQVVETLGRVKNIKLVIRDSISLQEIKILKSGKTGQEIVDLLLSSKKIEKQIKKGFQVFLKKIDTDY